MNTPADSGSIRKGLLRGAAFTATGLFSMLLFPITIIFFGALQYAWILPAYFIFGARGELKTANGILIISGVVLLLSAACWNAFR